VGITSNEYTDARAHDLRAEYYARFGGPELPVPVEAIAEDLLGLRVRESADLACSGMLIPATREIVLSAAERAYPGRHRFTLAHEVGHWICHVANAKTTAPVYCRAADVEPSADRTLEREANIFAAELLMPRELLRSAWAGAVADSASTFNVSEEAMHWRVYNLRLADDVPRQQVAEGTSAGAGVARGDKGG
jgi:hypothetical protein